MKDWIPLVGAFLGFVAGISGTWWTQRANHRLEAAKWERERTKAYDADRRQYHIDVAEHVESKIAFLRAIDMFSGSAGRAEVTQKEHQVLAKIRLFGSYDTARAWELFQESVMQVERALGVGAVELDGLGGSPATARPADEDLIPVAVLRGFIVICTVRAEMYEDGFDDIDGMVERVKYELPTDVRYQHAYDHWWDEFRQIPKAERWLIQSQRL